MGKNSTTKNFNIGTETRRTRAVKNPTKNPIQKTEVSIQVSIQIQNFKNQSTGYSRTGSQAKQGQGQGQTIRDRTQK